MGSGRKLDVTAPAYAAGGTDIPAGLAWVGEQGPELMYVPGGSSIYDHNQSMAMAARFSMNALDFATRRQPAPVTGGDSSMHVTVNPSPGMDEYALAQAVTARMMV